MYTHDTTGMDGKPTGRVVPDDEPRSPDRFYLICERRDDGGLRVTCPEVPGLVLSHKDPHAVMRDVMTAVDVITRHNKR